MTRFPGFLAACLMPLLLQVACEKGGGPADEDGLADPVEDTVGDGTDTSGDTAQDPGQDPAADAPDSPDTGPETSPDVPPDDAAVDVPVDDVAADEGVEMGEIRGYIRLEERPGDLAAPAAFFAAGPLPEPWAAVLDPVPGCAVHRMEGYPSVEMPESLDAGTVNLDGVLNPPVWLAYIMGQYQADPYDPMRYQLFNPGASLTARVDGGSGIPAMTLTDQAPSSDFSLTAPSAADYLAGGIGTGGDLEVTWAPGDGDFVEIVVTRRNIDYFGPDTFAQLVCTVPDTGSTTVTASFLAELPATFVDEGLIVRRTRRSWATVSGVTVVMDVTSAAAMSREAFGNPCTPGEVRCVGSVVGTCQEDGTWGTRDCNWYDPMGGSVCRLCSDGTAACVPGSATRPCDAATFVPSCDGDIRLSRCACDVVIEQPCSMGLSCATCDDPWLESPVFCTDHGYCDDWFFEPYCSGTHAVNGCACGMPAIQDCAADDPFGICCVNEGGYGVYCSWGECY
jgi:hypothetical protein